MNRHTLLTVLTALGLFLALGGSILAQGPAPQGGLDALGTAASAPLSTSFTYQGRLTDGGSPASGEYDFKFELHDDPTANSPVGSAVTVNDQQVTDGLFTVQLDFGDVFDGAALYLAIGVRPGSSIGAYTPLSPRQELTAAPYALYSRETAPHDHLGQTWTGTDNPLVITGSFGAPYEAALVLGNTAAGSAGLRVNSAGDGLWVESAGWDGLYVPLAGDDGVDVRVTNDDGVFLGQVGNPSTGTTSDDKNGFEVAGAEGHGLYVGRADIDGVRVESAGNSGVVVDSAGSPSTWSYSTANNGFAVAGAEGFGLFVGRADLDGVYVASAGSDGVSVDSAGVHGVYVGSAGNDGVSVGSAGVYGVYVGSADDDGVLVDTAGNPSEVIGYLGHANGFSVYGAEGSGLFVGRADNDGVVVSSAGYDGVYADTTQANQEWGIYTPDKIYAGATLASGGPLMIVAQSGDTGNLETGDVVAVSGAGAVLADGEAPLPLVRRASATDAVVGVVYRHLVSEEKVSEVKRDGKVERSSSPHTHSTDGPIAPGEYLLIVVLGPAQVKAAAGDIQPGDRLTAGSAGQVQKAMPVKAGDALFYPPGTIVGTAMEALDTTRVSGLIWVLVRPQ